MKASYKKYAKRNHIEFSAFVNYLMTWAEAELTTEGQGEVCRMAPDLYENTAIVSLVSLWWNSWFISDDTTYMGCAAARECECYSTSLMNLLFYTEEVIKSYNDCI